MNYDLFCEQIDSFIAESHIDICNYDRETETYFNLSIDDIINMNGEEAIAASIKISAYCSALLSELSKLTVKLDWVNSAIDTILVRNLSTFTGDLKYLKKEQRIFLLAENDEFIQKIVDLKSNIQMKHGLINDKLYDYRRIADRFFELGKNKCYKN